MHNSSAYSQLGQKKGIPLSESKCSQQRYYEINRYDTVVLFRPKTFVRKIKIFFSSKDYVYRSDSPKSHWILISFDQIMIFQSSGLKSPTENLSWDWLYPMSSYVLRHPWGPKIRCWEGLVWRIADRAGGSGHLPGFDPCHGAIGALALSPCLNV